MPVQPAWLARGEQHLPADDRWLTAAERAYADARRFAKRRTEFLLARYAAKTAVTRRLGLPADDLARIEIRHEPGGAPWLAVDGQGIGFEVSLTDRAGWAVCLVGRGAGRLGCDLELVEPRTERFVADWFTPRERDRVRSADEPELAANLIWSAKESALKVLGTGLRRDTRSVEVRLGPPGEGWQPLSVTAAEGAAFPGWWRRFGAFVLTTAAERPFDAPRALEEPELLGTATPTHSWLAEPRLSPSGPSPARPPR